LAFLLFYHFPRHCFPTSLPHDRNLQVAKISHGARVGTRPRRSAAAAGQEPVNFAHRGLL
jgi:hypothetical protein